MLKRSVISALGVVAVNEMASFINPESFPELEEGKVVHIIDIYSSGQIKIENHGTIRFSNRKSGFNLYVNDPNWRRDVDKTIKFKDLHKKALIGEMGREILGENDVIEFRIYKKLDIYHFSQPDFLFITILLYFGYATWEGIVKKYLINNKESSWFNGVYGMGPFPRKTDLDTPPMHIIHKLVKMFINEEEFKSNLSDDLYEI